MLVWFAVENWKCFRDRQELSMETVGQVEDEFAFDTGAKRYPRLNRVAAIYGPNGSGKSCFVEALSFMKNFVFPGSQAGEPINVKPFLFDARKRGEPTRIEIGFIRKGSVYEYGFSADAEKVWEEWLHVRPPGGRLQRWLDRELNPETKKYEWKFSPSLRGEKDTWRKATRPDALYVPTAVQLNSGALAPIIEWFIDLKIVGPEGFPPRFTSDGLRSVPGRESRVMDLLRRVDIPVSDIRIKEGPSNLDERSSSPPSLADYYKDMLSKLEKPEFGLPVAGTNELAYLPLEEQSHGTQRMYEFAIPWLDIVDQGLVVVVDELDRSLHSHLARFLVGLINRIGRKGGQHAQLVATLHDVALLQGAFDRNQIWLTEKRPDLSTSLTSLSDYKPRAKEPLLRGYLGGRYNAIPNVSNPETVD